MDGTVVSLRRALLAEHPGQADAEDVEQDHRARHGRLRTPPPSGESTAAATMMISTAYLKFRIMKRGVTMPIRARNSTSVGSWKTRPNARTSRR